MSKLLNIVLKSERTHVIAFSSERLCPSVKYIIHWVRMLGFLWVLSAAVCRSMLMRVMMTPRVPVQATCASLGGKLQMNHLLIHPESLMVTKRIHTLTTAPLGSTDFILNIEVYIYIYTHTYTHIYRTVSEN